MAFAYSTSIQDRIALATFGVQNATLNAVQKVDLDGTWTTGALTTGRAYDALNEIEAIANYFEMAGATSAPQSWESWLVWETASKLAQTYRPERVAQIAVEREKAIDVFLDSFTVTAPTGAVNSIAQTITPQNIRYFVLNHCSRRKESGSNTGMRRRIFPPIDSIDSHLQWTLNYLYNKEHWNFRKRAVTMSIKYLDTVTAATWTESTKTLTQTGAFTNLLLTNGPAMVLITDGTGATIGEYQVASKTSNDAIVLTTSISTANANLTTGDITAVMYFLDFRGLLANESIDSVGSRRFFYQGSNGQAGSNGRLNWVDETGMDMTKAYNGLQQGQPGVFRIENQPSGVKSWRLAPFPDADYTLNGSVYVSGPGTFDLTDTTNIIVKFPTEFGTIIRDMVLARVLQAYAASDADRFWARAVDQVQVLLPQFVDQGNAAKMMGPEDVYNDSYNLIGGNRLWGGAGGFGGGMGGLT